MKQPLEYGDVWFDVEYDYYAGCEGTFDVPSLPPRVDIWCVYIGGYDIMGFLETSVVEEMEEKILEENYGV